MYEISFVCPGAIEIEPWLKIPVEFPRSPVGVKVPDDNMFKLIAEEEFDITLTLIFILCPLSTTTSREFMAT
jgi:hypothetical protein